MWTTPEDVIEHLARVAEDFPGMEITPAHYDENQNMLTIKLESSSIEPNISQAEINRIVEPFDVEPENVSVYASSDDHWMDYESESAALILEVVLDNRKELWEEPQVRVEPVFEGVQTESEYCEIGGEVDLSRNDAEDYFARVDLE